MLIVLLLLAAAARSLLIILPASSGTGDGLYLENVNNSLISRNIFPANYRQVRRKDDLDMFPHTCVCELDRVDQSLCVGHVGHFGGQPSAIKEMPCE